MSKNKSKTAAKTKVTADTIKSAQIRQLLDEAREAGDMRKAALCMRALEGDSLYQRGMLERCADLYNAREGR
jgi:hypothetical protein